MMITIAATDKLLLLLKNKFIEIIVKRIIIALISFTCIICGAFNSLSETR